MRLGLIGTGKQGQRYLLEKNGGRHIKVSGSRRVPLDDVDGVIIATHPAGHKELALECIAAGKAVLIEKPLALNLRDCMDIIDAAEKAGVALMVAHTHLFSEPWWNLSDDIALSESWREDLADEPAAVIVDAYATYVEHTRDYSAWLDWGPHLLAMAAELMPLASPVELRASVAISKATQKHLSVVVTIGMQSWGYSSKAKGDYEPMGEMVAVFVDGGLTERHDRETRPICDYDFNRRVYRALFAED